MNYYKRSLALRALTEAITLRTESLDIPLNEPVCVFDAAAKLDLRVVFHSLETDGFEGLYQPSIREILLEPNRPALRQRFTCAHELGHHIFGHGLTGNCAVTHEGTLINTNTPPEEYLANTFASFFLMPKSAVNTAFIREGTTLAGATPEIFYVVATTLGVGYNTLLNHCKTFLSRQMSTDLAQTIGSWSRKLPALKNSLLGDCGNPKSFSGTAYKVTREWRRPIDLVLGNQPRRSDIAKFMFDLESPPPNIEEVAPRCYKAAKEGTYPVRSRDWTGTVRCYNPSLAGWWKVRTAGDD